MTNKKKYSLSFFNNLLFIVFLFIVSTTIIVATFINTQKVIDKNISDYFTQTHNLSSLILENEQSFLDTVAFEVSTLITNDINLKSINDISTALENFDSIDSLDLLFLEVNGNGLDLSNSLFDTSFLIEKIVDLNLNNNQNILVLKDQNKDIILMINKKKIIDKKTGRVSSVLYTGKIFNDNYSLLNKIKQKAKLLDVYLYYNNNLVATTDTKNRVSYKIFDKEPIIVKNDIIYSSKKLSILNDNMNFVYITKNSSFEVLKDSLIEQAFILLLFIVFVFILLYFFSNRFVIMPFSRLIQYAHKLKTDNNTVYKSTQILEFDEFADELKDIIYELRDLKEKYSRAIDGVQDGLWDIDFNTKKIFYSKRFLTMLGYEEEYKIKSIFFWHKHIHKKDYKKTIQKLKEHFEQKSDLFETEYRFRCKDGSFKWIKIRGKIFFDEKTHKPIKMSGFHTDINDFVLLQNENSKKEQMLYQQSKLAAMGEMIGNIAHQWRQPLTIVSVIGSSIGMQMKMKTLKEEDAIKDIEKLLDTVKYLSSIIDKFRNFFNPDNKVEEFYIDDMLDENLQIFESTYKSNSIDLIIDTSDVKVVGYKFELMQVIVNIINNAKDALVANVEQSEDRFIFLKAYIKDKKIIIKIYDNAGGIDKKIKDKIYEPYFTTKHQSQGTGLGLYMSSEIIQKHFHGKLTNKTITYEYNAVRYKGEEFTIEI